MDHSDWIQRLVSRLGERQAFDPKHVREIGEEEFPEFFKRYFEVSDSGIHIHGIKTEHDQSLSLESKRAPINLEFKRCHFRKRLLLNWAEFDSLSFVDCEFDEPLVARALTLKGRMAIIGSTLNQGFDLTSANIGADVKIEDTTINATSVSYEDIRANVAIFCGGIQAHSFILERVTVNGRTFLGTARLGGILRITGKLNCPIAVPWFQKNGEWDHVAFDATDAEITGQAIFGAERRAVVDTQRQKDALVVRGQVNLSNATLGGDLVCTGGHFFSAYADAPPGNSEKVDQPAFSSIYASRLQVDGAIFLDRGFHSIGEVRMNSIKTRGVVRCDDADFDGRLSGDRRSSTQIRSISFRNARLGSSVYLDRGSGSHFWGKVDLHTATIGGDLDMRVATCHALSDEDDSAKLSNSFAAIHAESRKFSFSRLIAKIRNRSKKFHQATLDAPIAVDASGTHIEGSVHLSGSDDFKALLSLQRIAKLADEDWPVFRSYGCVRLRGARIDGNLHLEGGVFRNIEIGQDPKRRVLNCQGVTVGATTFLAERGGATSDYEACAKFEGSVTFEGMSTETWEDAPECWPQAITKKGKFGVGFFMELNGLSYRFLKGPLSGPKRLAWLLNQPPDDLVRTKDHAASGFKSQPWEQCANILEESGYERDAKFLLRTEHRFLRLHGRLTWLEEFYNAVLGILVGHGHRVFYSMWWAVLLLVTATISFSLAWQNGQVTPAQEEVLIAQSQHPESLVPDNYPKFSPLIYSLDIVLPVGDFHQHDYWTMNDKTPSLDPVVTTPIVAALDGSPLWVQRTVTTLLILGLIVSIRIPFTESFPPFGRHGLDKTWGQLYRYYIRHGWIVPFDHFRVFGFPLVTVLTVHIFFFLLLLLYLGKSSYLEIGYLWVDAKIHSIFGVSLPNFLMTAFQIFGWILVSAIVAGIGNSVFAHTRNRQ